MCDTLNPLSAAAAAVGGGSNAGEVRIDIWKQGDNVLDLSRQITHRVVDDSTAMIVETTLGLSGQAVGAVMAISLGSSTSSWPLYLVELLIIMGLTFTYAAISLRRRRPEISVVMAKIGATAIAAAIVISAASHLPPLIAFIVAPYALLVIAVAVVFA